MTELRELIALRLLGDGSWPWADRVVETGAMTADQGLPWTGELPWIVVRQAATTVDLNRAPTEIFEVWIHAPSTSFAQLDGLERLAVALLDRVVLVDPDPTPGRPLSYALGYAGTVQGDQVIPEWDAYARAVRFQSVAAALGGPLVPDDPRAAFLRAHLADLFCLPPECIQTDPTTWAPTDSCPGIWIRPLTSPIEVIRYSALTLFREVLSIQVLGSTFAGQNAWVDKLALELPGDVLYVEPDKVDGGTGIPPRRSTMLLRVVAQDLTVDPLLIGQLSIEAQFSELACDFPPHDPPLRVATARLPEDPAVTVERSTAA